MCLVSAYRRSRSQNQVGRIRLVGGDRLRNDCTTASHEDVASRDKSISAKRPFHRSPVSVGSTGRKWRTRPPEAKSATETLNGLLGQSHTPKSRLMTRVLLLILAIRLTAIPA